MSPTIDPRAHRAGFTLIELLVVVALISIMLVIAVPSFTSFISNYRATSAVNDFLQGITLTRNEALKRGRRMVMMPYDASGLASVNGDWKYGWAIFLDVNSNNKYDDPPDQLIFKHDPFPASIVVTNASGGASKPFTDASSQTAVSFDGTGYPRLLGAPTGTALAGGIVLTDTTGSSVSKRTLCLANLGRPRIVKDVAETCAAG